MDQQQRGQAGEQAAADYLIERGFRLLGRNLRRIGGEIDLLMQANDAVILVEVKALTKPFETFDPLVKINSLKRRTLWRLASQIAAEYPDYHIRIDACAVSWDTARTVTVTHYPSVIESW